MSPPIPKTELNLEEIKAYRGKVVRVVANFRVHSNGQRDRLWKVYDNDACNPNHWQPLFKCYKLYLKHVFGLIDEEKRQKAINGRSNIHAWIRGVIIDYPASRISWRRVIYKPALRFVYADNVEPFESSEYAVFCEQGLLVQNGE